MDTTAAVPIPKPFMPHPNFSDEVNRNIVQSEIEGGVYLDELSEGAVLEVETQHHWYTIVIGGRGRDLISGHPEYCPDPVPVRVEGWTWGGSMLKVRFIGRGMRLEFAAPSISDHRNVTDCGHPGLGAARKRRLSSQKTDRAPQACRTSCAA